LIHIDRYAYSSYLKNMHPNDKLSLAVMTMLLVLAVNSLVISILVMAVMTAAVLVGAGVKLKHYLQMMMIPMAFLLISCATVAIDISLQPLPQSLGSIGGRVWLATSPISIYSAFTLFVRSLAAISCLYFLALTTPMVQIISVLRTSRVPGVVLDLMSLTYHSIFIFYRTAQHILTAQVSRGGYGNLSATMRSLAGLGSNLVIKCIRNSDQSYQALLARGFSGELNVLEDDHNYRKTNFYPIAVFEGALLGLYLLGRF
jgi:cobalt/nickel transport system permease protein